MKSLKRSSSIFCLVAAAVSVSLTFFYWRTVTWSERPQSAAAAAAAADADAAAAARVLPTEVPHLAVVACGDRREESMVLLKSVLLASAAVPIHIDIFVDSDTDEFRRQLNDFLAGVQGRSTVTVRAVNYTGQYSDWKMMFRPCASLRLFLPELLANVDATVYVDTDVVFIKSLHQLWKHFEHFNESHIAAFAAVNEDPLGAGWYTTVGRNIPHVAPSGLNSGVALMNLTRIRKVKWLSRLTEFHKKHASDMKLGDQDLLNVYFHYFARELYNLPCEWNYCADHCRQREINNRTKCASAEQFGAGILHGNGHAFHTDDYPIFRTIYNTIHYLRAGQVLDDELLKATSALFTRRSQPCDKLPNVFLPRHTTTRPQLH